MAPSKKENYSKEDIKLALFAKALSHPARISILKHLASMETCCFSEISRVLPIADSTVSQHLSELKNAGLIQGNIDPPRIQYCINYENWRIARKYFKDFSKIKVIKNEKDK